MSKTPLKDSDRDGLDTDLELDNLHNLLSDVRRRLDALEGRGTSQLATGDGKRLNKVESRLHTLEKQLEALGEELGENSEALRQTRETYARNAAAGEQEALGTLAKATNSFRRQSSAAGVLARAEKVLTDPTSYGVVESLLQVGQLAKAQSIVENAEKKGLEDEEDDALENVQRQVERGEQLSQLSELSGVVGNIQRTLESITRRLTQLERRPAAAPATVAKAVGGRQRGATVEYKDTPGGLMTRVEAAFDDPGTVGTYSSMLQSKNPVQIEQVRLAVEAAELAHESRARRGR